MTENEDLTFRRFRIFNAIMGGVHLLQVFLVLYLSNNFSLPLTITKPVYNEITNFNYPCF